MRGEIPVTHAILAEERGSIQHQPADPTETLPFPDALLQVGWVVQVGCGAASTTRPLQQGVNGVIAMPPAVPPRSNSSRDARGVQAARDPEIQIPPEKVPLVYGLACSIHFLLPAADWYAAKWEGEQGHFERAVLHAVNSGGNNMARAALTGEAGRGGGVFSGAAVHGAQLGCAACAAHALLPHCPRRLQAQWWARWWASAASRSALWMGWCTARTCVRWRSRWRPTPSPTHPSRERTVGLPSGLELGRPF